MPISPESQPLVTERLDEVAVPSHLENEMQKVETAFTATVRDAGNNQPIISAPATQNVTIQLPTDQTTLIAWSKGSITNAITWFARFWLRMLKKGIPPEVGA